MKNVGGQYNLKKYMSDFKEGIRYMRGEAGLMAIAAYFTVMSFSDSASNTLLLPFLRIPKAWALKNTYLSWALPYWAVCLAG